MAGEFASRAIQPIIFVILARLLTPNDYGVMAAAVMVISFTQIFWEAGMGKALIQRQTQIPEASNSAFWINCFLAFLISVPLYLFSDLIALKFFNDIRVSAVLKVMTLQVLLGAAASIHTARLQKEMKFNKLFWVRISTIALPGLFSIPLAWSGFSYWALVAGTLVGQLAQVIVLWRVEKWRPSFSFDKEIAWEMGRFGLWVGLSGLLGWFYLWMDSLFVGSFLGTHELGLYRTGNQFITMIFGFLFAPLLPVLYSHLSSIQLDRALLKNWFVRVVRIITFISIPLAFLTFALADEIGGVVFGSKWEGIGFVISVMALMHGYSWVVGANGEVYRAIGKPSYETIVNVITLLIYLLGYYFSIQKGFETFVWTRFALALIAMLLHIGFGWLAIGLPVVKIFRLIITATGIGAMAWLVQEYLTPIDLAPFLRIIVTSILSFVLIGPVYFLLERNDSLKDLFSLVKKKNTA